MAKKPETNEAQRQPQRSPYSEWDTFSVPSLFLSLSAAPSAWKALPAEAKAKSFPPFLTLHHAGFGASSPALALPAEAKAKTVGEKM